MSSNTKPQNVSKCHKLRHVFVCRVSASLACHIDSASSNLALWFSAVLEMHEAPSCETRLQHSAHTACWTTSVVVTVTTCEHSVREMKYVCIIRMDPCNPAQDVGSEGFGVSPTPHNWLAQAHWLGKSRSPPTYMPSCQSYWLQCSSLVTESHCKRCNGIALKNTYISIWGKREVWWAQSNHREYQLQSTTSSTQSQMQLHVVVLTLILKCGMICAHGEPYYILRRAMHLLISCAPLSQCWYASVSCGIYTYI